MAEEPIDPTASTSPGVNRRAFVALGAGAVAVAPAIDVRAADAGYGRPHPPIVAEDDPAIVVERSVAAGDVTAYLATPKRAATRGIVVSMHVWGVDAQLRDVVRRLAKRGYAAIAADLYAGLGAPTGDGATDAQAFIPYFKQLDAARIDDNLTAAAKLLQSRGSTKLAVLGFCGGGGNALRQTVDRPDLYAAAAIFYGQVGYAAEHVGAIRTPIVGSYGARDTSISASDVRDFFDLLEPSHDVRVYDEAGHAFFDDTRKSYVPSAAHDAWQRTQAWFEKYLD